LRLQALVVVTTSNGWWSKKEIMSLRFYIESDFETTQRMHPTYARLILGVCVFLASGSEKGSCEAWDTNL
jgi:hypothetical protein